MVTRVTEMDDSCTSTVGRISLPWRKAAGRALAGRPLERLRAVVAVACSLVPPVRRPARRVVREATALSCHLVALPVALLVVDLTSQTRRLAVAPEQALGGRGTVAAEVLLAHLLEGSVEMEA